DLHRVSDEPADATFLAGPEWLDRQTLLYADGPSAMLGLFTIRPDGTRLHRLRSDAVDDWQPSWSPGERQVAFTHGASDSVIEVVNADGSGLRQLTESWLDASAPSWSPDGRSIAFFSWNTSLQTARVYVMHADGSGLRELAEAGQVTPSPRLVA